MGQKKSIVNREPDPCEIWLREQLKSGCTVESLINPCIHDICDKTTHPEEFASVLNQLDVLTSHQKEACLHQPTNLEKNGALYKTIIMKNEGMKMVDALVKCKQTHIIKMIYQKQMSPPGSVPLSASSNSINNNRESVGSYLFPPIDSRVPSVDSCTAFGASASDQPLVSPSASTSNRTSCISNDVFRGDEIIPLYETLNLVGKDVEGKSMDLRMLLPFHKDNYTPKRKIILNGHKFKIRYLVRFLELFKDTVEHLELNGVTIIPRSGSKIIIPHPRIQLRKLKTFVLDQVHHDVDIYLGLEPILTCILHKFSKECLKSTPSLWSMTKIPVIDIKRNGETVLIMKKLEGQQQLVLRDYAFLDYRPFLHEIIVTKIDLDKLSGSYLSLIPCKLIPLGIKELNLNNCTLQTEKDVSITETLLKFKNLTRLIIDCRLNSITDFSLDIKLLMLESLQVLILRKVTLTGALDEGSELIETIKKKEKIVFYQCDLDGLNGVKTNRELNQSKDCVIFWPNPDNESDNLVWGNEASYDEDIQFDLFQISDFVELEAWKKQS